jgi:hypothetical protein
MDLLHASKAFNLPSSALKHSAKMNESNTKITKYVVIDGYFLSIYEQESIISDTEI